MKKTCCITLALALSMTAGITHAFSLGDAAKMAGAVVAPESPAGQSAELVGRLTDLNVSSEQAIGGTSALLNLAKNQLPGADYSQLLSSVPALSHLTGGGLGGQVGALGGLLGKSNPLAKNSVPSEMNSLVDVSSAFSALGMDSGMIGQFAPVLLQFLGDQGASSVLLQSLSGIWGAQSPL